MRGKALTGAIAGEPRSGRNCQLMLSATANDVAPPKMGGDGGLGIGIRIAFQSIGYQPNGGSSVSWDYRLA